MLSPASRQERTKPQHPSPRRQLRLRVPELMWRPVALGLTHGALAPDLKPRLALGN
jgi:hypothetical protein